MEVRVPLSEILNKPLLVVKKVPNIQGTVATHISYQIISSKLFAKFHHERI